MKTLKRVAAGGVVLMLLAPALFIEIARDSPVQFGVQCLAENVYWESRKEPYLGQEMVAYVTLARAHDHHPWWGGSTLCGVVFYAKHHADGRITPAFTWTVEPAAHAYPGRWWQWARAVYIATSMSLFPRVPVEGLKEARYYLNSRTSQTRDACWFEKSLVELAAVGHHRFYRNLRPKEKPPKRQLGRACKPKPRAVKRLRVARSRKRHATHAAH